MADLALRVENRTAITKERVLRELARIAFFDSTRAVKFEDGRVRITETGEMSEDDRAAISEMSETITESGGSVRVKAHDKQAALMALAKHLGLITEKVEHSGLAVPLAQMTPEERAARIALLRAQVDAARA